MSCLASLFSRENIASLFFWNAGWMNRWYLDFLNPQRFHEFFDQLLALTKPQTVTYENVHRFSPVEKLHHDFWNAEWMKWWFLFLPEHSIHILKNIVKPLNLELGFDALSFYVTKTVLVGPKRFWSDQIDFDLTLMIWSRPKWNGHDQNEMVTTKMSWSGPNCDFRPLKITIWTWPINFGCDHFILVKSKSIWSDQNHFGPTKTVLVI